MSIDDLLFRQYDRQTYNCCHFSAEAWQRFTGDKRLHDIDESTLQAGDLRLLFTHYQRVDGPTVAPSIVLMQNLQGEFHMGVCVRRRLLHIREEGAVFLPFDASLHTYRNFRFYQ